MNRRPKISMDKKVPLSVGMQTISPKTMTMCILLAVMVILWGRVLLKGKNGPASANAQDAPDSGQMLPAAPSRPSVSIEAVTLPELAGHHDTLSRDMFRTEDGTGFGFNASAGGGGQVGTTGDSPDQVRLERIARRLVLEAVVQDEQGRPVQAYVDEKILSVGSTLTVNEGPDQYVLTLEKISEKEVEFSWNQTSVVLKMAETFEL